MRRSNDLLAGSRHRSLPVPSPLIQTKIPEIYRSMPKARLNLTKLAKDEPSCTNYVYDSNLDKISLTSPKPHPIGLSAHSNKACTR
jgi:hypothetical protein